MQESIITQRPPSGGTHTSKAHPQTSAAHVQTNRDPPPKKKKEKKKEKKPHPIHALTHPFRLPK